MTYILVDTANTFLEQGTSQGETELKIGMALHNTFY